jgi:hypothetical protein
MLGGERATEKHFFRLLLGRGTAPVGACTVDTHITTVARYML